MRQIVDLFMPNFYSELWNGVRCGPVGAIEHFGVDEVESYMWLFG